ncbi:UvrD-helicase domain-containing protein [Caballeronia sp. S22]|uniref:UvrD-helicase domain-containing protein n=1 Tax=Caballeronia sp. S22 TaxID=3137182 RepID=UPI00353115BF
MDETFSLSPADLANIATLFPALDFSRQEQIDALLHATSGDFQAAPGSGKTTLLGAKLSLMAARWPYAHRGICILTHTNVARQEIEGCLKAVPYGASLLGYPHFIGTIQSFVNKFLAIPWLRELGIELREIDEQGFEREFYRRAYPGAKTWIAQSEQQRKRAVCGVRYRGADLALVTTDGHTLPASGVTIEHLRRVKAAMAREGRLRHEDMFAYAEQALVKVPNLADAVEHRFPNVFIDEMQDTSDVQLSVLNAVFREAAVVQRFGDVNQAILSRGPKVAPNSFPRPKYFEVRTSLRFGSAIAAVVNAVKPVGGAIDGLGPAAAFAPTMILYSDATVQMVIKLFGEWVASLFSSEELTRHPVKAVCAIKTKGNAAQKVGRHISDYFPSFDEAVTAQNSGRSIRQCLRFASNPTAPNRVGAARSVLLLMVQTYGVHPYKTAKTWKEFARLTASNPEHASRVKSLALQIVTVPRDVCTETTARSSVVSVLAGLGDMLDVVVDEDGVPPEWLIDTGSDVARTAGVNSVSISTDTAEFSVQVATIASVKGETHLATLVLESCRQKVFDLKSTLPFLCGTSNPAVEKNEHKLRSLMNIFVAASRPKRLLAFAMHADRADVASMNALRAAGWEVKDWAA